MKKTIVGIAAVAMMMSLAACSKKEEVASSKTTSKTKVLYQAEDMAANIATPAPFDGDIVGGELTLEVAKTMDEKKVGLSDRETLEENNGMVFVFDTEGFHPFWMRKTPFSLDFVYLNKEGIIVDVKSGDPCTEDPCTIYLPSKPAMYVIEIPKGNADKLNMVVGNKVEIEKYL